MLRNASRAVDANLLNGIGGKLEQGEDFLHAAIRETAEETGYTVSEADCKLRAVVNLEGGYPEDWVMCFFMISVPTQQIPHGSHTPEGELMWLAADQVLHTGYEVVDDLHYCWEDLVAYPGVLFLGLQLNDSEKITHYAASKLPESTK